ncbi:hypothetical protein VTN77DRAFT_4701 [Rasamsonia byssochlamydoides]|uniref:uncharacterized protein n=1 Tax=Rasamsonia byssochlamydoides TaxID=89139 RepID=UPI003743D9C8
MDTELECLDLPPTIPNTSREDSDLTLIGCSLSPEPVALVKTKNRPNQYRLPERQQLQNNLLTGVGFLELANALDFAANVWNSIPIPRFVVALMAAGGSVTVLMSLVAVRDAQLSWSNLRQLWDERKYLDRLKRQHARNKDLVRYLDRRLGVNFREIGSEVVDRVGMDVFLGIGGIIVGIGTLLAIGGANPTIFHASNLLSGYIGNALAAVYGLVNAVWSAYLWVRFRRYASAVAKNPDLAPFRQRVQLRFRRFRWHGFITAMTGLVAGAASMITATMWWGYIVLIPCIVSSVFCNVYWRAKLGYDRQIMTTLRSTRPQSLTEELAYVVSVQQALVNQNLPESIMNGKNRKNNHNNNNNNNNESIAMIIQFIVDNNMFDQFCEWLFRRNQDLAPKFASEAGQDRIFITPDSLVKVCTETAPQVYDQAKQFLYKHGRKHFEYRERYLLELLGYDSWRQQAGL